MHIHMIALLCSAMIMAGCGQSDKPAESWESDVPGSSINLSSLEGSALARRKCASCHLLDRNNRRLGPSLKGIMGKKPSISGVPYEIWTEAAMDEWIRNPRAVKETTRMSLPGISDAEERRQIISFLKHL
ncbi:MAG: c-type cytochrome [Mariprofundaceae bacterium]|nr:c-type cytochrome [Mariprofundaceae bacterium]